MNQYQLNVAQASKCHRIGNASFPLMDDRQRGQRLVAGLPDGTALDPVQVLSAVHDLLPASDPMLEPLKLMVQRPEFLALAMPRQANRQTNAQDQEEALLRFLSTSYSPEIVDRLREILTGIREQWAPRSPRLIEPIYGKSSESSPYAFSEANYKKYLQYLDSTSVSSSVSSAAPPDQTGQTTDSIPPQTSPEDPGESPQKMRQSLVVDNPIVIETFDETMEFYGFWGLDLFQKNKFFYFIYICTWPLSALVRLLLQLFTYLNRTKKSVYRIKSNIEKNMTHINDTLTK
jgi:hypothetical protein